MPSTLITGANKSLGREPTTHTLQRQAAEEISAAPVNVFGAVRTIHAFPPLLRRAQNGMVVNVSSGLGSHALIADPAPEALEYPPTAPSRPR